VTRQSAPDQRQRDRIVSDVDETLFVDAGAGSGKTTQLVERVVELVRRGVPIGRIAAITFTEAAAAELRDRIRRRLDSASRASTDETERKVLADASADADAASIQTLHAFAQSILRAHPVAAGLPPSLEVADEISSVLAFEDRFATFRDGLFNDPAWREVLRCFLLLGMKEDELKSLAKIFNDNWDRLPSTWAQPAAPPSLPRLELGPLLDPLRAALALRDCCSVDDKLTAHLDNEIAELVAMLERSRGDHVIAVLRNGPKISRANHGDKDNWAGRKPEVIANLKEASAARESLLDQQRAPVVEALSRAVGGFVLVQAERRRRDGRLEFHDLLVRARDLLRADASVRRQLAESHQRILVDEFQDTDPLQLDIVTLICGSVDATDDDWRKVDVDAGRVFFVGDPKQSIYRFRRADVKLYGAVRQHYGDGLCELTANFRTVPGIIEWVNHTFGELIQGDDDGQPDYLPLQAVRDALGDGIAPITVIGGPRAERAQELRANAAAELVEVVRGMVADGRQIIDDDGPRAMDFGDVVVLVPSRIPVPALEEAFSAADVPYRLETASLIWGSQEVREVMAVLRAVEDPGDEIGVVAALRTPMLGCSDDDLAEWRATGGRWSYLGQLDEVDLRPVATALRELAAMHRDRWWLGPDGLVELLATEYATFQFALLAGRRRDRWRRLRFVADQARAYVETQRGDLGAFLAWAELQSSDIVRVSSPTLPETDQHAVRVMTIHASKGLEFPVVALFGLDAAARSRSGVTVLWEEDEPKVSFGQKGRSDGYEDLLPADEQMGRHERMRLLYVGATRARDRLILCTHHKSQKSAYAEGKAPFGHLIHTHLPPGRDDLWLTWVPEGRDVPPRQATVRPTLRDEDAPADSPVAIERQDFQATRAALLASDHRAVWSATAVAKAAAPGAVDTEGELDDQPDDQRVWRRGRAGTAIGRAVHGTLQLVDFTDLSDLDAIARSQAAAEGVDHAIDTVASLARAGAEAPIIRELTARRHWREMYVSAPIGGSVVEGYVDLLAEDGDGGLVVLDYKTDTVRNAAEVEERTERYRLQAATYALAIEAVTDRPVTRASFLFLGTSGAIEATVDDLEAAKAEAMAVLDGNRARSMSTGPAS
jgi:ATP-dependent exoDNAse (exonuclease V) beta subunit